MRLRLAAHTRTPGGSCANMTAASATPVASTTASKRRSTSAQFDHPPTRAIPKGFTAMRAGRRASTVAGVSTFPLLCGLPNSATRVQRLIRDGAVAHPQAQFVRNAGCNASTRLARRPGRVIDSVFTSFNGGLQRLWLTNSTTSSRNRALDQFSGEPRYPGVWPRNRMGTFHALKQRYLFSRCSRGRHDAMGFEVRPAKISTCGPHHSADWPTQRRGLSPSCDVNSIKQRPHAVFREESPRYSAVQQPDVMLLWISLGDTGDEALLILNKDPWTIRVLR